MVSFCSIALGASEAIALLIGAEMLAKIKCPELLRGFAQFLIGITMLFIGSD
jgi:hypothetical protein